MQVRSLDREDPLKKEMAAYPSILPGKSQGQRSLTGYNLWGHKESNLVTKQQQGRKDAQWEKQEGNVSFSTLNSVASGQMEEHFSPSARLLHVRIISWRLSFK